MSLTSALKQNLELLLVIHGNFKNDLDLAYKKLIPFKTKKIKIIKTKFGIESDMSVEHEEYKATQKEANKIRKKYNLTRFYHDGIINYLYDKKIHSFDRQVGWKYMPFKVNSPRNPKEKIVVMPLFPESNITDIKKYWKDISNRKNNLYFEIYKTVKNKKIVTRKNFKRDIEIYKFQQSGDKAKEVTKKINKKYPNAKIQYQDVSKIIQRLKNLAEQLVKGN